MQIQSPTQMTPGRIYRFKTPSNNRLFMYERLDEGSETPRFVKEKAHCVDLFEMQAEHFGYSWRFTELEGNYTLHIATDEEIAIWNSLYPSLKVQQSAGRVDRYKNNNHYSIY